ncbi:hypothetical protein ACFX1Z_044476 [Malus domestica]
MERKYMGGMMKGEGCRDMVGEREAGEKCRSHWVPELRGPIYTNTSCATIPESRNCFKYGRIDKDFLNWRWKPDNSEVPWFDPKTFLEIVRGKKMAVIGDSVAQNHFESLLCLLSQEESPKDIYKDFEDHFTTWYFPQHDFTLMKLWSKFLIAAEERMAEHLPDLDYAIFSAGHWFNRIMYLHQGGNLIRCFYCGEPNVTNYNSSHIVHLAFRTAFKYIMDCKYCKGGLLTLLRTFTPAHFEGGVWNTSGYRNQMSPLSEADIDLGRSDWELRSIQVEEIERARKEGEMQGKTFRVLDVTRAMFMSRTGTSELTGTSGWTVTTIACIEGKANFSQQYSKALEELLAQSQREESDKDDYHKP